MSTARILEQLNTEGSTQPVDRDIIEAFRRSLSWYSLARERRILRNKRRHASFRPWKAFSPQSIIACDLCFLYNMPGRLKKNQAIFIAIDVYSRKTLACVQNSNSATSTLRSYEKLLPIFLQPNPSKNYRFCAIDKGGEFKSVYKSRLESAYKTKLYSTKIGPWPKISLVERVIR